MTAQPPLGPTPDDELVSAYLDGEVTADERARVEGDQALRARVERLGAVRAALQAPVEQPPAEDVERLLAAALAAADTPPPAVAPSFDELRQRRRPSSLPAWLSVAALVIALLVAVPLLASLGGGGDDHEESAATATADDDSGGEESAETEALQDGGDAAAGAIAPAADDLGPIADEAQLRDALAPRLAATRVLEAAPATGGAEGAGEDSAGEGGDGAGGGDGAEDTTAFAVAEPCPRPELGTPVYTATAHYQDNPAVVLAYAVPEGTRVLVLAVDGCRQLADLTL